uniref:Olfactory receptor n=1 Tax=Colobus angolensis palliatus TaxID=336983 RepID=A0A2K5HZU5_COLAP
MCSGNPASQNQTAGTDFILTGLFAESKHAALYTVTFMLFLTALAGKALLLLLLLLLLHSEPRLHTPMYFFISQLALMGLMYICVTVPKMLVGQVTGDHTVSPAGCGTQMFFYLSLAGAEVFLLAAMACDRYAAVCRPLITRCASSWCQPAGFWEWVTVCCFTPISTSFPFGQSRKLLSFFWETPALLKLSCSDTLMYLCCILMLLAPVTTIPSSYTLRPHLIRRRNSAAGRRKALATCSSHAITALLRFGAASCTHVLPSSCHSAEQGV